MIRLYVIAFSFEVTLVVKCRTAAKTNGLSRILPYTGGRVRWIFVKFGGGSRLLSKTDSSGCLDVFRSVSQPILYPSL